MALSKLFSQDAWLCLEESIKSKQNGESWECSECDIDLETRSVGCDSCLNWYHFHCAGIKQQPRSNKWFCKSCK